MPSGPSSPASPSRHIVAMSAGRATMMRRDDPIHTYVLELSGEAEPKVAFIPTASGDDATYIVAFYETYDSQRCRPSHLSLFYRHITDVRRYLLDQDVIVVGGGSTANLLSVWRLHGVDVVLREAWERGVVLCGGGAGGMCWFEGGVTSSFGISEPQPVRDGLAFLNGSFCPHYDIEPLRRRVFRSLVTTGVLQDGYAIEDDTALHFEGSELRAALTSRAGGRVFSVASNGQDAEDRSIDVLDITAGRDVSPWYAQRESTE
jgi:dipeptidase E